MKALTSNQYSSYIKRQQRIICIVAIHKWIKSNKKLFSYLNWFACAAQYWECRLEHMDLKSETLCTQNQFWQNGFLSFHKDKHTSESESSKLKWRKVGQRIFENIYHIFYRSTRHGQSKLGEINWTKEKRKNRCQNYISNAPQYKTDYNHNSLASQVDFRSTVITFNTICWIQIFFLKPF